MAKRPQAVSNHASDGPKHRYVLRKRVPTSKQKLLPDVPPHLPPYLDLNNYNSDDDPDYDPDAERTDSSDEDDDGSYDEEVSEVDDDGSYDEEEEVSEVTS